MLYRWGVETKVDLSTEIITRDEPRKLIRMLDVSSDVVLTLKTSALTGISVPVANLPSLVQKSSCHIFVCTYTIIGSLVIFRIEFTVGVYFILDNIQNILASRRNATFY